MKTVFSPYWRTIIFSIVLFWSFIVFGSIASGQGWSPVDPPTGSGVNPNQQFESIGSFEEYVSQTDFAGYHDITYLVIVDTYYRSIATGQLTAVKIAVILNVEGAGSYNYGLYAQLSDALLDPMFRSLPYVPQPDKADGKPTCDCVGDPISAATGNLHEEVTDYTTVGINPLAFTRYYNSHVDTNSSAGALGTNWRSAYDRYLRLTFSGSVTTAIIAERADGQELIFNSTDGTNWTSDADVDIKITKGAFDWTLKNTDDSVETYDSGASGTALLTSIRARDGYVQTLQYNGNKQLASVVDSYGEALQFSYANNLLHNVTTPSGLILTYNYSAASTLAQTVSSASNLTTTITYLYENAGLPSALTGIIDENGNRFATWTYDTSGRATSSQHANGVDLTQITYNPDGTSSVSNALGQALVYKFVFIFGVSKVAEIDRLASPSVPAAVMTYAYDRNGYLANVSDWKTELTGLVNDTHGQPLTINEAVGTSQARTTAVSYLGNFHLPSSIVAPRKTTVLAYDLNGNALTVTETDASANTVPYSTTGQTRTWTRTFDNTGHVLSVTGPRTDVTATNSFTYDVTGNLATATDALGHLTQFTNYNGSGLPLTMVDPNGVVTTFTYDVRDRLLARTVRAPSGDATIRFAYDGVGQVVSITLPDGSLLGYQYDAAHRLQSVTNSLGERVVFTRDAAGNIIQKKVEDDSGFIEKSQTATFDQLGRMLKQIGAYSETTVFGYDADNNRISITDPLTNTTTRAFDALNRLVSSIDPLTNGTGFSYDAQDNLTSVTDPRSLVTAYVYDGFRHVIQESSPDKGVAVYQLDKAGNRVSETDARGVVTLRTFDALNRVVSQTYPASPGENITYTYDATNNGNFGVGRMTGYTDETGNTILSYNERGDVISAVRVVGGVAYTNGYAYDLANRVVGIAYPSGHFVGYVRDAVGRVARMNWGSSSSAPALAGDFTYLPFGPVRNFMYGNGLDRVLNYDLDYRLTDITTMTGFAIQQQLHMTYDAVNDIVAITNVLAGALNQTLSYDADYRLTLASGGYGLVGYSYDGDDNRLSRTVGGVTESYAYSSTENQLLSTATTGAARHFSYTPAGNIDSDDRGTATNLLYNYGNRNRYKSLTTAGQTIASYGYNAIGQRVIKSTAGGITHYHYDLAGHLIAESNGNGTLIREYVWLDDMPLAQIEADGTVYYIHTDHLNTPQKMTDASGNVVWEREQQPFGETVSLTANSLPPSRALLTAAGLDLAKQIQFTVTGAAGASYVVQASTSLKAANWVSLVTNAAPFVFTDIAPSNAQARFYRAVGVAGAGNASVTMNLRFPGQYFDAESGLNYNMMRDYDMTLGQYIESDPVGLDGGLNIYGYAAKNPFNKGDPTGLLPSFKELLHLIDVFSAAKTVNDAADDSANIIQQCRQMHELRNSRPPEPDSPEYPDWLQQHRHASFQCAGAVGSAAMNNYSVIAR